MTLKSNIRRLFTRLALAFALVNIVAANAHALSKESERRLNEMQLEASAELKVLQGDFKKRMQARRDEPIVNADDLIEAEEAAPVAIAAAGETH